MTGCDWVRLVAGNRAAAAAAAAAADLDSVTFRQQALSAAGTSLAISAPTIRAKLTQVLLHTMYVTFTAWPVRIRALSFDGSIHSVTVRPLFEFLSF